ncbi:MAG: hypothetical protein VB093_14465 [Propionicimonas sp.]|nr:hypothetical protein [Propionicimonas sp.]
MENRIDFGDALASQPRWLERADSLAALALAAHPLPAWAPGETVAVIGMGAATNAGTAFVEGLRQAGVRAVNLDASAASGYPVDRLADHVVLISESGRSPEPIAVAQTLPAGRRVVITNDPGAPLAQYGDVVIPLGGFTDSGVYTIGYTTTLVALARLARTAGVDLGDPAGFAGVATQALAAAAPHAASLAERLDGFSSLDIVGQGTSYGSAVAVALLVREAAGLASAPYETYQYLHGPMEGVRPPLGVLVFGDGRERALTTQLAQAGVDVIRFVADTSGADARHLGRSTTGLATTVAEVVFTQVIVAELARRRSMRIGNWRFPQPDTKLA